MTQRDDLVRAAWEQARTTWPEVEVPLPRFVDAVAQRADAAEGVDGMALADVYLACACAAGERNAIDCLERTYLKPLRPAIARLGAGAALIDDVMARVRERLFAADPPAIAQYQGRGDLSSWLKVVVMREAVARLRKDHHLPAQDEEIEALMSPADDPELEVMRHKYRGEFRQAFEEAMAALETRERIVLRYHLIDRLSIDQIAAIHGVHRATAARWLARVRERLYKRTRRALLDRLGVSSRELDSILRLIRSQLDVSIGKHLTPLEAD